MKVKILKIGIAEIKCAFYKNDKKGGGPTKRNDRGRGKYVEVFRKQKKGK